MLLVKQLNQLWSFDECINESFLHECLEMSYMSKGHRKKQIFVHRCNILQKISFNAIKHLVYWNQNHSVALILLFQVYYSYINCLKPKLSFSTNDKPYTHIHVDHIYDTMMWKETQKWNKKKWKPSTLCFSLLYNIQFMP